jgi:hypothetical protein
MSSYDNSNIRSNNRVGKKIRKDTASTPSNTKVRSLRNVTTNNDIRPRNPQTIYKVDEKKFLTGRNGSTDVYTQLSGRPNEAILDLGQHPDKQRSDYVQQKMEKLFSPAENRSVHSKPSKGQRIYYEGVFKYEYLVNNNTSK